MTPLPHAMHIGLVPFLIAPLSACMAQSRPEVVEAPLRSSPPAQAAPRTVAILLFEGVELLDFAGPGEVFSAAHGPDGHAFRVTTVASGPGALESQGFVTITPEHTFEDCPAPDILVVPGGSVPDDQRHVEWVRRVAATSELVLSVCNGAHLLADADLLTGLEATTHHGSLERLALRHPQTRVYTNRRFVDNGAVMTCAGVSAGIDGALHVVERLLGAEAARSTARYMEYEWRPEEIRALHAQPGALVQQDAGLELAALAREKGVEAALACYRASEPRPDEGALLRAGDSLLGAGEPAEARALFELVVAAFPDSANAQDRLAEACEDLGDASAALRHTRSALERLERQPAPANAAPIRSAARSRLARLGQGDAQALVWACPPCSQACDAKRHLEAGRCPSCHMQLGRVAEEDP